MIRPLFVDIRAPVHPSLVHPAYAPAWRGLTHLLLHGQTPLGFAGVTGAEPAFAPDYYGPMADPSDWTLDVEAGSDWRVADGPHGRYLDMRTVNGSGWTDDYYRDHPQNVVGDHEGSMLCWFRKTQGVLGEWTVAMSAGRSTASAVSQGVIWGNLVGNANIEASLLDDAGNEIAVLEGPAFTVDDWFRVVFTWRDIDTSPVLKLFVDGVLSATATPTSDTMHTTDLGYVTYGLDPFGIGHEASVGYMMGATWDRCLPDGLARLLSLDPSGLVAPWRLYQASPAGVVGSPYAITHHRFRNDDGSESTATWKAAEDTNVTVPRDTKLRLRVQVDVTGDQGSSPVEFRVRDPAKVIE